LRSEAVGNWSWPKAILNELMRRERNYPMYGRKLFQKIQILGLDFLALKSTLKYEVASGLGTTFELRSRQMRLTHHGGK
jgi:hypothetical protein